MDGAVYGPCSDVFESALGRGEGVHVFIGSSAPQVGKMFEMRVVAWIQTMTTPFLSPN